MFVHISPEVDAVGETISTLKFAERVATVELGAARVNKDSSADVKELKEQIANLKAALSRKEGDSEQTPPSISGSADRYRAKASDLSPFRSNQQGQGGNILGDLNSIRQPMGDVGNIEIRGNSALGQKKQNFDLDELLANSPPWPPAVSPGQNREEDRDIGSGDWVDKDVISRNENPLSFWESDNGHLPDVLCQNYPDRSFNMFTGSNLFDFSNSNDADDLDAATSDSSEPDLLWQFNHAKLASIANNGIGSKTKKPNQKPSKSPGISKNVISPSGPSPSRKIKNGASTPIQRIGRQPAPTDMKRRPAAKK